MTRPPEDSLPPHLPQDTFLTTNPKTGLCPFGLHINGMSIALSSPASYTQLVL